MSKIFITGANSFIGNHVIAELIAEGYTVVGSVRSTEKGEQVKKVFPKNFEYVVVPDVSISGAYDEALKAHADIEGFFNVVTTTSDLTDYEKDTIAPAIESVKTALYSVKKYAPKLKRFVHTSSIVAMGDVRNPAEAKELSGSTWNTQPRETVANAPEAYFLSKTLSEKALWEFLEKEKPSFTVNVVNPSLVLGPEYATSNIGKPGSSLAAFAGLLKLKKGDEVPPLFFPTIDVRDIAKAQVYAYKTEDSSKRYLLSSDAWTSYKFVAFISKKFPELGLPEVPAGAHESVLGFAPKVVPADLGISYIDGEKTVLDTYTDYIKELLA